MWDLVIEYDNSSYVAQYSTIMDFIDDMEADNFRHLPEGKNLTATFFENKLNVKKFENLDELLQHCKKITK